MTVVGPPPALSDHVDFIPGQIRTTFNLHDHVWVKRGGELVDYWPGSLDMLTPVEFEARRRPTTAA